MTTACGLTADQVAALVAASRAAQGLPAKITDPVVLDEVAAILATVRPAGRARTRRGQAA